MANRELHIGGAAALARYEVGDSNFTAVMRARFHDRVTSSNLMAMSIVLTLALIVSVSIAFLLRQKHEEAERRGHDPAVIEFEEQAGGLLNATTPCSSSHDSGRSISMETLPLPMASLSSIECDARPT